VNPAGECKGAAQADIDLADESSGSVL